MGTNLTQEKIEKIKLNYKNKKQENFIKNKICSNELIFKSRDNFHLSLKKLYQSQYTQKIIDEDKINNINNINCTIDTEFEKNSKIKNNIDLSGEANEINNIIFRKHESFDYTIYSFKNLNDDIFKKKEIYSTSMTLTTTVNTVKIKGPNSLQDDITNNSDYVDISQSILFSKYNDINEVFNKEFYGNGKRIRDGFYNKLIIKKIWNPLIKEQNSNTIFIFDWDDTLFCTSYLIPFINSSKKHLYFQTIKEKLKNLDENISNLLSKALDRGMVFIITNSSPGWVEYSSTNFYFLTAKILSKIKIISAKGLYSKIFPDEPKQWKINAFKYVIEKYNINTKLISNIISFGDSIIDLEAIENLKYSFSKACIKIIKFKENPHPVELEKQIWIVISQLDLILNKAKNFTVKVSKKKVE